MEDLKAMFSDWDDATLQAVLAQNNGNVEGAVDTILSAGSAQEFRQQQTATQTTFQAPGNPALSSVRGTGGPVGNSAPPPYDSTMSVAPSTTSAPMVEEMLVITAPANAQVGSMLAVTHRGQTFFARVPPGVVPGSQFAVNVPAASGNQMPLAGSLPTTRAATAPEALLGGGALSGPSGGAPPTTRRRGRPVSLPADFLRVPGTYDASQGRMGLSEDEMTDEQLAQLLQDELFLQELAANPEFSDLHRGGAGGPAQQRAAGAGATRSVPARRSSRGPGGANGATMSGSVSAMGSAIKNRLKAFGRSFARNREREYAGLDTTEDPLPWNDDDDEETLTFNSTSNVLHLDARPLPRQPSNVETPGSTEGEEGQFFASSTTQLDVQVEDAQAQPQGSNLLRNDRFEV